MTRAADVRESARQLRAVLAEIEAGRLVCSAAARHRIEGAVLAMDTFTLGEQVDDLDQLAPDSEVRT